jgi:hypothetical protein
MMYDNQNYQDNFEIVEIVKPFFIGHLVHHDSKKNEITFKQFQLRPLIKFLHILFSNERIVWIIQILTGPAAELRAEGPSVLAACSAGAGGRTRGGLRRGRVPPGAKRRGEQQLDGSA